MSIFDTFRINASGMTAERFRMDTISQNMANANTTRTANGKPYRRKVVTFTEKVNQGNGSFAEALTSAKDGFLGSGVKVDRLHEDTWTKMNVVYDPSHPDADRNGYVTYPNVNTVTEMTNLIDASNAYQSNATAFEASKAIANRGLELFS